ncbi:MAG: hypothetical protein QM627_10750, partial [Luteolibacter sp.]
PFYQRTCVEGTKKPIGLHWLQNLDRLSVSRAALRRGDGESYPTRPPQVNTFFESFCTSSPKLLTTD